MNRFEYKAYNTAMETEVQLTRALEDAVRWRNYAEDLIKERDGWMDEYSAARAEVERLKIDRDLFRKERDILKSELEEAIEINCNCNADGCHNSKLLSCKDLTIERLESELTEGVEIMSSIYHNVDKYHLSISFKNGELFDRLKDYLGV